MPTCPRIRCLRDRSGRAETGEILVQFASIDDKQDIANLKTVDGLHTYTVKVIFSGYLQLSTNVTTK